MSYRWVGYGWPLRHVNEISFCSLEGAQMRSTTSEPVLSPESLQ